VADGLDADLVDGDLARVRIALDVGDGLRGGAGGGGLAMVCWAPPVLSSTLIGWRMALMPTLSMAILRESG